jgi:RNA polymerase sigma factor (sigma-70 family)
VARRVLVVDDESLIVEGVSLLLEFEQIESAGATDRDGAVTILTERFFPVIITDLCLHTKEEGLRLLDDIRTLSPLTKVMVLSAYAGDMEDELLERGVTMVMQKPATNDMLLGAVTELLARIEDEAAKDEDVDLERLYLTVRKKLYSIPRSRFGLSHEQAEDVVQEAWILYSIPRSRFGLSHEQAEDVVQEAWILFLQKRGMIRLAGPWLSGAVANLARQKIDQKVRKRETFEGDEIFATHEDQSLGDANEILAVRQALSRVDDRTRTLCHLIGIEGLSYEEVCEATGMPLGSIGPLYIRAKQKLRKALAH